MEAHHTDVVVFWPVGIERLYQRQQLGVERSGALGVFAHAFPVALVEQVVGQRGGIEHFLDAQFRGVGGVLLLDLLVAATHEVVVDVVLSFIIPKPVAMYAYSS